ncbi:MAG TPA: DUF2336 domain-containing protein [Stellaceae bacterium]|nr:DUF2336 domain-containing protein [Stellaceae bacterium]
MRSLANLFGRSTVRRAAKQAALDYDRAKELARSNDPVSRVELAASADIQPEILYFLARDADPAVRRAVAANPRTPRQADLILALDDDPAIRLTVAQKIASVLPELSQQEAAQLWGLTVWVLEALMRDDAATVRQSLADAVRGIGQVPSAVAQQLARDRTPSVAVSALGFVGRLEDADLIEVVRAAPDQTVIDAVARRPDIGSGVTDAIIEHGEPPAVATVLANPTAQVAEATIDRLIEVAPAHEVWHEPLVRRPVLSSNAVLRLASFVTGRLLGMLLNRPDLEPATAQTISAQVNSGQVSSGQATGTQSASRVSPESTAGFIDITPMQGEPVRGELVRGELVQDDTPIGRARQMSALGELTEELMAESIGGDRDFLAAALAIKADLSVAVVQKILASHSAKGMTALAWRAGCGMRLALQLQLRLAHLPPKSRLHAIPGGGFPLTPDEMRWQIEFFDSMVSTY